MGEIADRMIEGEYCALCGIYLEPNETVYMEKDMSDEFSEEYIKVKMPKDGSPFGVPVLCQGCKDL
jgi:hypothetical protein